jgi:hypothetical protein
MDFLPVERELGETPVAIPPVIHRANHKSFLEIHREIREFQTQPVLPDEGMPAAFQRNVDPVAAAPAVRPAHPRRQPPVVMAAGTVGVTALGTASQGQTLSGGAGRNVASVAPPSGSGTGLLPA